MTSWEALNYIEYLDYQFTQDDIKSGSLLLNRDLTCASLAIDTFSPVVECDSTDIQDFERDTPLYYYRAGRLRGVYYVQDIQRVTSNRYKITAQSAIALLDRGQHMGGIYTGEEAGEVLPDISGGVPISIKTNLAKQKLYGWLPVASPRSNLSQVLFALGATVRTGLDGKLHIASLWDGLSGTVPANRIYRGATVDYGAKVTQVAVTEHQYFEGSETQNLFEGTTQEGDPITFDEPMHSLVASGFTILESGPNYAKVSAGSGTLTGKAYIHNTRLITRDVLKANTPNIKTFEDATLVSLVNSSAVADRLAAYYKCRETINASVVHRGETAGDCLSVYHPYDETTVQTCLQSADITLSNTLKAQEKLLVGYIPKFGGEYELIIESIILTGTGTFLIPEGVNENEIEVIVIGAGGAGTDGESGTAKSTYNSVRESKSGDLQGHSSLSIKDVYAKTNAGLPSEGGAGGLCGTPGKVLEAKINVVDMQEIQYSCGVGGSNPGQNGGETFFGPLSSANGSVYKNGYFDVISNKTYAVSGENGLKGGDGGNFDSKGESVSGVSGGDPVTPTVASDSRSSSGYFGSTSISAKGYTGKCGGGGAGGSSGNIKGKKGGNAFQLQDPFSFTVNPAETSYVTVSGGTPGPGGDGANGADGETYGSSGSGGGGGGGSGACGVVEAQASATLASAYGSGSLGEKYLYVRAYRPAANTQGNGGLHGKGADGCIIVRYKRKIEIKSGPVHDKENRSLLDRFGRRIVV